MYSENRAVTMQAHSTCSEQSEAKAAADECHDNRIRFAAFLSNEGCNTLVKRGRFLAHATGCREDRSWPIFTGIFMISIRQICLEFLKTCLDMKELS